MSGKIIFLTGARNAGKSTVCLKTATLAREQGYTCGGLITLRLPGDRRAVLDLRGGTLRLLTAPPGTAEETVPQGRFRFLKETLTWGDALLTDPRPCHLWVVDELGPLEIERRGGWWHGLETLRAGNFRLGIAVVRPELVASVQAFLPLASSLTITVTHANRDRLPSYLVRALGRRRR